MYDYCNNNNKGFPDIGLTIRLLNEQDRDAYVCKLTKDPTEIMTTFIRLRAYKID